MSWNYRVMKKINDCGDAEFGVYEVYYHENGVVKGYSLNSVTPTAESLEALKTDLGLMSESLSKDVLTYEE